MGAGKPLGQPHQVNLCEYNGTWITMAAVSQYKKRFCTDLCTSEQRANRQSDAANSDRCLKRRKLAGGRPDNLTHNCLLGTRELVPGAVRNIRFPGKPGKERAAVQRSREASLQPARAQNLKTPPEATSGPKRTRSMAPVMVCKSLKSALSRVQHTPGCPSLQLL